MSRGMAPGLLELMVLVRDSQYIKEITSKNDMCSREIRRGNGIGSYQGGGHFWWVAITTGLFEEMAFELKLMKKCKDLCPPKDSLRAKYRFTGPILDVAN